MTRMCKLFAFIAALILPAAAHTEVFSVPVSKKIIEVEMVLPNGELARVSVREGAMITVRDEAGNGYGFVPMLSSSRVAGISLLEIKRQDTQDHVTQLDDPGSIRLGGKSLALETAIGTFDLKLVGVALREPAKPKRSAAAAKDKACCDGIVVESCCVTCGTLTVCGDSVALRCGECGGGAMVY